MFYGKMASEYVALHFGRFNKFVFQCDVVQNSRSRCEVQWWHSGLSCVWLQFVELTTLNAWTGRAYTCIRDVTVYVIVQMEKMN